MRCSSRSTTCLASVVATLLLAAGGTRAAALAGGQDAVVEESAVRHAVENAVRARMGQDIQVRIEAFGARTLPGGDAMTITATPEPGARLGRATRFTLHYEAAAVFGFTPGQARPAKPAGYAIATVFVSAAHVRPLRPLARGEAIEASDIENRTGDVGAVMIQRLPERDEVVGAMPLRDLMAGEVVTRSVVAARPYVQSGDLVVVRAAVEGVIVEGRAVAEQTGGQGDIVLVVNKESRRTFKARVVGPGQVEVVQ